jgi:hypothetical protein
LARYFSIRNCHINIDGTLKYCAAMKNKPGATG